MEDNINLKVQIILARGTFFPANTDCCAAMIVAGFGFGLCEFRRLLLATCHSSLSPVLVEGLEDIETEIECSKNQIRGLKGMCFHYADTPIKLQ